MKKRDFVTDHIVKCSNCDKDVLDHMETCPFCGGKLEPTYKTSNLKMQKKIRIILWVVLGAVAVTLIILKATQVI